MAVYQSDPEMEDDSGFVTGSLAHLVEGSQGRLLDARRTPITVLGVDAPRGSFAVRIDAFEDQGARWELALEEAERFQFPRDAPTVSKQVMAELSHARNRFDRELLIAADPRARAATLEAIGAAQQEAAAHLRAAGILSGLDPLDRYAGRRRGEPQLATVLESFLDQHGLVEIDRQFAAAFVSNPHAGELVKGHAIVLARLGLCPYRGKLLRDPDALLAPWSYGLRRRHIVARLGFIRGLFDGWGVEAITLYRATATQGPLDPGRGGSFVSATFSAEVAEAHFQGGPSTTAAVMWRQDVPVGRLFMSFLETGAHNQRYLEAEAVLIGDPGSGTF
jgi:hypothetical protein